MIFANSYAAKNLVLFCNRRLSAAATDRKFISLPVFLFNESAGSGECTLTKAAVHFARRAVVAHCGQRFVASPELYPRCARLYFGYCIRSAVADNGDVCDSSGAIEIKTPAFTDRNGHCVSLTAPPIGSNWTRKQTRLKPAEDQQLNCALDHLRLVLLCMDYIWMC